MNFQDRFKGRTTLMTKSGIEGLFPQTQPVPFHTQSHQERLKFSITPNLPQKPKKIKDEKPIDPVKPRSITCNTINKLKTEKKETPTQNFKSKNLNSKKEKEPNPYLVVNPYQISDSESNKEEEQYFSSPKHYESHPDYEEKVFDEKEVLRNYHKQKRQDVDYIITSSPLPYDSPFKNPDIKDYSGSIQKAGDNQAKGFKNKVNTEALETPEKPKETYTKNMIIAKKMLVPEMKGLGPNINTEEWKEKKEKMDKMNQFAMNVKLLNSQKLSETKPIKPSMPQIDENSAKARREKAMEFAKMVPKPTIKREASRLADKNNDNNIKTKNVNEKKGKNEKNSIESNFDGENELEKLERMHLKHQQEIEKRALKRI